MVKDISLADTVLEYINWGTQYLERHFIENPRYDAEEIFSFLSGKRRIQIYLEGEEIVEKRIGKIFASLIKKRAQKRYPLQYIMKNTEFFGFNFIVLPGVFIPRSETEIVVETVINMAKLLNGKIVQLLDIGTGSGCISISLAKILPNVQITATDIASKAIEVTELNIRLNNLTDRIKLVKSDLFTDYRLSLTSYDIIVSNPPYIPSSELNWLQPEIKFEPRIALDGREDGLFFIKKIIDDSPFYLSRQGILVMEIGLGQAEAVKKFFAQSYFEDIQFFKDYRGIERVVVLRREKWKN